MTARRQARRMCAWCAGDLPAGMRADAVCCSTRCRQARHRFTRGVGTAAPGTASLAPLRLAYADPPYPGLADYYRDHPDYAGEVDHPALIRRLSTYDGWALSTSAAALPAVLASCPPGVRVAAWIRGARPHATAHRALSSWEPVIYHGGRASRPRVQPDTSRLDASAVDRRRLDSLVYTARPRLTDPARVIGAKPAAFAAWVFGLLGAAPGDELHDLFPGSGGITRAWAAFTAVQDDAS